ncbi:MAG: DNA topoisomerase 1 [Alphaproteobacteria bacterium MarineAlpha9_Bin2]|nr:MAG: DNA topoisomerase 1 [Alphaproteobacteria bacterium MarineAlpha9_Bin2]
MNIVVVESFAKSKTIGQYLGKDYKVISCQGHVRDLPEKSGMVLPEKDFAMKYAIIGSSKPRMDEIKNAITQGDVLWLATDPDREGEGIAWHLKTVLEEENKLENVELKRITFHEITKSAILEAFKNPKSIDNNLVDAYRARLALDYLTGYQLSPILIRKLKGAKSAGRVQSVALKLICEREIEVEAFKPQEYWTIETSFSTESIEKITAILTTINDKKIEKFEITNSTQAEEILVKIKASTFKIKDINKKRTKRNPYAPFRTSSLQQEAHAKLGFSAKNTMDVAQSLYNGVDIKGRTAGLITYMRTDSNNLSDVAISQSKEVINELYGDKYLLTRKYKNKSKHAQEAHEAIRPTDLKLLPKDIENYLTDWQKKLYDLIWKRTIASQMASAEIDELAIDIISENNEFGLRATGSETAFEGFRKVYSEENDDQNYQLKEKNKNLSKISKDEKIKPIESDKLQHFTQPPARFTEASLIKKLEDLGIGRPSTYQNITLTIKKRGYVNLDKRRFIPTARGRVVSSFLSIYFKKYIDYKFTENLEIELDEIYRGKKEWKEILEEWWFPFKEAIDEAANLRIRDALEKINEDLGPHFFPDRTDGKDPHKCPKCENGKLQINNGSQGGYIGCSNWPDCNFNTNLSVGAKEIKNSQEHIILGKNDDGLSISLRSGPYGHYVQLGESEKNKKPPRATIPKNLNVEEITLEIAKKYLSLPRNIGSHPETGKMITAQIGKFGPYVKHEKIFASIPKNEDVFEIGINRAVDLIVEKQMRPAAKYRKFNRKIYKKSSRK